MPSIDDALAHVNRACVTRQAGTGAVTIRARSTTPFILRADFRRPTVEVDRGEVIALDRIPALGLNASDVPEGVELEGALVDVPGVGTFRVAAVEDNGEGWLRCRLQGVGS